MAECRKNAQLMHNYLDGELSSNEQRQLKAHLDACKHCRQHFSELKKTIALVQSCSHIHAPEGFTERVLFSLPKEDKSVGVQRWLRKHPFFIAAALFLILMTGSLFSNWQKETESFAFTKYDNIEVEDHTVIVPEGEVIKGDMVVENGDIRIEGEVQGDVTVIKGERYMASAGKVTGEIEEIDQAFGWMWFKIKETAAELFK
ncbi:anti-sigma factor family protein [Bacillus thermotolerans]|uniref:anti-sigma factor family protein n=1 Tax=Bacillus thermotolerans TaxID=1221996 RepID=UPI00057C602A|nr:anti-sigma factor [Bacillus thermotolerans]